MGPINELHRIASTDEYLKNLLGTLPETLDQSNAPGTIKIYGGKWRMWEKWCERFDTTSVPAQEEHAVLFLLSVLQQANSTITLQHAAYAIKWGHERQGLTFQITPLIKKILEASKRILAKPTNKKQPVTSDEIKQLVGLFINDNVSLPDLRDITMFIVGFCGFLRFNEIINIKRSDIDFKDNYATIFLESSKTDKYKEGNTVFIAATKNPTCPIGLLKQYLSKANIDPSSDEYIFRAVTREKKKDVFESCFRQGKIILKKRTEGYKLRTSNKKLSYTRCRELLCEKLEKIGLNKSNFGIHSLRSGGATQAARMQVSDRLFKKHGRWRSENCKDGYVHENIIEKLSVTLSLGL